jgi:hypothetical protein
MNATADLLAQRQRLTAQLRRRDAADVAVAGVVQAEDYRGALSAAHRGAVEVAGVAPENVQLFMVRFLCDGVPAML